MKVNSRIITAVVVALIAFSSCSKTTVTRSEPLKTQSGAAAMALYDYTQSIDKIYLDATGSTLSPMAKVNIIPGKLYKEDRDGIVCEMRNGICMVVITEKRHRQTTIGAYTSITGGTADHPIIAIKATDHWPGYTPAQELSFDESDESTTVKVTPVEQ